VKALWDVGRRTRRRLGTIGTDLDRFVAVVFDERGRVAEVREVGREALGTLPSKAPRPVVRLPWVRANGRQVIADRVREAAETLGLDVTR
jgi:hypothetical protein